MGKARKKPAKPSNVVTSAGYNVLLADVARVIVEARQAAARSVNAFMTATYWLVGRRIVEQEQRGKARASYGEALLERLSADLTRQFGRGFSVDNLEAMRTLFLAYPSALISETPSRKSLAARTSETLSRESIAELAGRFRLSWSHYVMLLRVRSEHARGFYETEALRGGWTVRQLRRQIDSQFYERTALSRDKAAMLRRGAVATAGDIVSPEEQIKDPYVLEFLGLRDEYSESDLEDALIRQRTRLQIETRRNAQPASEADRRRDPQRSPSRGFRISKARLAEMVEQATVDAYGESEQSTGWFTMIDENLAVPFETTVFGLPVTVERIDMNASEQIVAVCRRGRTRQVFPILDVPLPAPAPQGAEWVEAYRRWRGPL